MKKKLLMMAIALIGLTGLTANAQEAADNNASRPTPGQMNKMRQPREFTEFAFEGILLDINQQQRMDSLNAAVKANRPERPERACCAKDSTAKECKKADCKKEDCKKDKCQNATNATDCKAKAPKAHRMMRQNPYGEEYVAKVKEILTPDQFAIFEENISNMPNNFQRADKSLMKEGAKARKFDKAKMSKADRDKAKDLKSKKNKASNKETK